MYKLYDLRRIQVSFSYGRHCTQRVKENLQMVPEKNQIRREIREQKGLMVTSKLRKSQLQITDTENSSVEFYDNPIVLRERELNMKYQSR